MDAAGVHKELPAEWLKGIPEQVLPLNPKPESRTPNPESRIQMSVSLEYEPASEPLHISVK